MDKTAPKRMCVLDILAPPKIPTFDNFDFCTSVVAFMCAIAASVKKSREGESV